MKKYTAVTSLVVRGKNIEIGETVELDDADADRMSAVVTAVDSDVAATSDAAVSKKSGERASVTASTPAAAVLTIIGSLEVNETNYNEDGKPSATVIADILNIAVSAELRDEAWNIYLVMKHDAGSDCYNIYAAGVGGKTFDGKPLPVFDELGDKQKEAWFQVCREQVPDPKKCWNIYAAAVGGKTYDDKPLPEYKKLGKQQKGWQAVADWLASDG